MSFGEHQIFELSVGYYQWLVFEGGTAANVLCLVEGGFVTRRQASVYTGNFGQQRGLTHDPLKCSEDMRLRDLCDHDLDFSRSPKVNYTGTVEVPTYGFLFILVTYGWLHIYKVRNENGQAEVGCVTKCVLTSRQQPEHIA